MDETIWGHHVQMMDVVIQECRAVELAMWRSRVSGAMSTLSATASKATATLAELQQSQRQMTELATRTLLEAQVRDTMSEFVVNDRWGFE